MTRYRWVLVLTVAVAIGCQARPRADEQAGKGNLEMTSADESSEDTLNDDSRTIGKLHVPLREVVTIEGVVVEGPFNPDISPNPDEFCRVRA